MSQYLQVCLFFVFLFFAEGSLSQMASGAEDGESVVFSSQESMVGINDDSTSSLDPIDFMAIDKVRALPCSHNTSNIQTTCL